MKRKIAYIYVTQHLGMAKHTSDQILVIMHNGEVVERGNTAEVLASRCTMSRRLITSHFGEALSAEARRQGWINRRYSDNSGRLHLNFR